MDDCMPYLMNESRRRGEGLENSKFLNSKIALGPLPSRKSKNVMDPRMRMYLSITFSGREKKRN